MISKPWRSIATGSALRTKGIVGTWSLKTGRLHFFNLNLASKAGAMALQEPCRRQRRALQRSSTEFAAHNVSPRNRKSMLSCGRPVAPAPDRQTRAANVLRRLCRVLPGIQMVTFCGRLHSTPAWRRSADPRSMHDAEDIHAVATAAQSAEADIDLSWNRQSATVRSAPRAETGRLSSSLKPSATAAWAKEALSDYQFGTKSAHHSVLPPLRCPFIWSRPLEQIASPRLGSTRCADNAAPEELIAAPVRYAKRSSRATAGGANRHRPVTCEILALSPAATAAGTIRIES